MGGCEEQKRQLHHRDLQLWNIKTVSPCLLSHYSSYSAICKCKKNFGDTSLSFLLLLGYSVEMENHEMISGIGRSTSMLISKL